MTTVEFYNMPDEPKKPADTGAQEDIEGSLDRLQAYWKRAYDAGFRVASRSSHSAQDAIEFLRDYRATLSSGIQKAGIGAAISILSDNLASPPPQSAPAGLTAEFFTKHAQGSTLTQSAPQEATERWTYRRYGSEPEKGYTIVAGRAPIAFLGDGEVAMKAADAICEAHNGLMAFEKAKSSAYASQLLSAPQEAGKAESQDAWPDYIAGIIETYVKQNRTDEDREKGIAGIIRRRMYLAPKEASKVEPVVESVEVIRGIMQFIRLHAKPGGFDPELAERRVNARLDTIILAAAGGSEK